MVRQLVLILLISHIIADFAVRREVLGKSRARQTAWWPHILVFASLNLLAFLDIALLNGSISAIPWAIYSSLVVEVALFHWLVDRLFQRTDLWDAEKVGPRERWLYVIQQGLKVGFIFFAAGAVGAISLPVEPIVRPLAYVFGYVFSVFAGDAFVCLVLTRLTWTTDKEAISESVAGGGRLIGIFEALLVTTFVIAHQYTAIGVILAAKSLARFEWLKDHEGRAEYFLVGTLANLTWSALGGLLALWFAGRPLFPG